MCGTRLLVLRRRSSCAELYTICVIKLLQVLLPLGDQAWPVVAVRLVYSGVRVRGRCGNARLPRKGLKPGYQLSIGVQVVCSISWSR